MKNSQILSVLLMTTFATTTFANNDDTLGDKATKWKDASVELGAAAWESTKEVSKDAVEGGKKYADIAKDKTGDAYEATAEKSGEVYDSAKETSSSWYDATVEFFSGDK